MRTAEFCVAGGSFANVACFVIGLYGRCDCSCFGAALLCNTQGPVLCGGVEFPSAGCSLSSAFL